MAKKNASTSNPTLNALVSAARSLIDDLKAIRAPKDLEWIYNPLEYAWRPYHAYLSRYVSGPVDHIYLGMNPGPWGMAQTGVPFGEIASVQSWLGIDEPVDKPPREHPKRPIQGFACKRSEVSGSAFGASLRTSSKLPKRSLRTTLWLTFAPWSSWTKAVAM